MKRVLIISPHFPPVNAPDMQRVRMGLPYYKELGWEPVVLCVDERFVKGYKDPLLNDTIPGDIEVHRIGALPESIGIGNLSIRSYTHFKRAGNRLLRQRSFDLVFFSTSLFYVCVLGRYWEKKFGVPFVVDMHDPWRNDFYLTKPRSQRPSKFWLDYQLSKKTEAYTMPYAAGLMAVSQAYIDTLRKRYRPLAKRPALLLPFGLSAMDFQLVRNRKIAPQALSGHGIKVVYMGAINKFFLPLIRAFFLAFKRTAPNNKDYHFYFIGTNYYPAPNVRQVEKIGEELGLAHLITEVPERIPYFTSLSTLMHADILFIPGSLDADYNASKVYNNIFSGRPVFSIYNEKSLVKEAITKTGAGVFVGVNETDTQEELVKKVEAAMPEFLTLHERRVELNKAQLSHYLAHTMAEKQIQFFNKILGQCVAPLMLLADSWVA